MVALDPLKYNCLAFVSSPGAVDKDLRGIANAKGGDLNFRCRQHSEIASCLPKSRLSCFLSQDHLNINIFKSFEKRLSQFV